MPGVLPFAHALNALQLARPRTCTLVVAQQQRSPLQRELRAALAVLPMPVRVCDAA